MLFIVLVSRLKLRHRWKQESTFINRGRVFITKTKSQTLCQDLFCLISLLQAFFSLYTCQDSDQQLYCSTVSRITHVNTEGEFAAGREHLRAARSGFMCLA